MNSDEKSKKKVNLQELISIFSDFDEEAFLSYLRYTWLVSYYNNI